jgi:predicted nuclease of predicted toxin-antitoxin system
MRFLVDAQLPPVLARWLAGKGFAAEHVFDLHMETAPDSEIWSRAARTGAVIVTKDEDFVALATSSSSGPRVLWVRLGNSTRRELLAWMDRAWPAIARALDADERVVEIAPLSGEVGSG